MDWDYQLALDSKRYWRWFFSELIKEDTYQERFYYEISIDKEFVHRIGWDFD